MANYKLAARENWKFQTVNGLLTVGQLFTASDDALIKLEEDLKEQVKSSKTPNRFQKSEQKDEAPKMKLAIVTDIIDTLIGERDAAANEAESKVHNQKILKLIKEKQDKDLDGKSIEELEKMLK